MRTRECVGVWVCGCVPNYEIGLKDTKSNESLIALDTQPDTNKIIDRHQTIFHSIQWQMVEQVTVDQSVCCSDPAKIFH